MFLDIAYKRSICQSARSNSNRGIYLHVFIIIHILFLPKFKNTFIYTLYDAHTNLRMK